MLTTAQINEVINKRASGVSLNKISVETGISKPTLLKLVREFAAQILARKYMLFDEMNEKYALSIEKRIELFGETLQKINQEPGTREKRLFRYQHGKAPGFEVTYSPADQISGITGLFNDTTP